MGSREVRLTRWQGCIVLIGLCIVGGSAALAIQGRWMLAGWVILTALVLGNMLSILFTFRRVTFRRELGATREALEVALRCNEEQLRATLLEQYNALLELSKAFARVEKKTSRIEQNGALQRELLEGKLWGAAIPLPILRRQAELRGYLAAVVIVKDEGPYLREWLEFHRLVGVEHIYLYDNGSSDNSEEVLSHFLGINYVTRIPWSSFVRDVSQQRLAYAHALSNFGPAWRWMALIDSDEFLFPTEADGLPSVLTEYEHLPALAVYWRTFGFSGHEKRPSGLVIENFTMRAPFPPEPGVKPSLLKFKTIVDPSRTSAVLTPHVVKLENGLIGAYTEDGASTADRNRHASNGQLRINHYYTKSKEELEHKLARGSGAGMPMDDRRKIISKRIALIEKDLIEDKTIQRFLPELRHTMTDYPGVSG